MSLLRRAVAIAILSALLPVTPEASGQPRLAVEGYAVTRFGAQEGAPPSIWAIAQDRDGYLWVGSNDGLFRFDGFLFEPWRDLSPDPLAGAFVRTLRADSSGGLWVGFDRGGASYVSGGRSRNFHDVDGLPGGGIRSIVIDSDGVVWAGARRGLFRFSGDRWQPHPQVAATAVASLFMDAGGGLWVGTNEAVLHRGRGENAFVRVATTPPDNEGIQGLCLTADGRVLRTDPVRGFDVVQPRAVRRAVSPEAIGVRVHCASDGSLWVATAFAGLWQIGGPLDRPTVTTGLLAPGALALAETPDGTLWVGATDGLYRLVRRQAVAIRDVGIVAALVSDPAGTMWAGTFNGVRRYRHAGGRWLASGEYLGGERTRTMHLDRDGHLWVGTNQGVARISASGTVSRPPWGHTFDQLESLSSDSTGTLWLFDLRQGLFRIRDDTPRAVPLPGDLAREPRTVIHVDRQQRLWIVNGAAAAQLSETGAVLRHYSGADGLPATGFRSLHEDNAGALWLGSRADLTRLTTDSIDTLPLAVTGAGTGGWVNTITQSADGELWLGAVDRILRLREAGFTRAVRGGARQLNDEFSVVDLLPSSIRSISNHSSARSSVGDLWFTTDDGIAIIDPAGEGEPVAPRAARITGVEVDGGTRTAAPDVALAAGTARIRINFGALDLAAAHRLHFRYRLEGFDDQWIEAGDRRSADYTSLDAGSYVFHVVAERDAAGPPSPATAWTFAIAPHFYETAWFGAALALLASAAGYGAWRLRLATVRRRFALVLGERARLSREIHDTLLQDYVGVALELQAMAHATESGSTRGRLLRLRQRVDQQIAEARDAIWHLRAPVLDPTDLSEAIRQAGERAVSETTARFELAHAGPPLSGASPIARELLVVAQEAIVNAVRHGRPATIRANIACEDGHLSVTVADDGCGFDPDEPRAGRFGLSSMRERVEALGGRFAVASTPGGGTTVEATVPLRTGRS